MRLIKVLFLILSLNSYAEVFHYGVYPRSIEIKASEPTLLKFEQAPIASACQPGIIEFDPVAREQINVREMEQIKESSSQASLEEDQIIKTMIKAKPNGSRASTKCAFTLLGGAEVHVEFQLVEDIARPLVELKSIHTKTVTNNKDSTLNILRSLTEGTPMMLHDMTKDFQTCETVPNEQKTCKNFRFETKKASYELSYVGSNADMSAWIVKGKPRKELSFKDLADFKQKTNAVQFSLTLPQKDVFKEGDKFTHYIIAQPNLSKKELIEVLQ